MSLLKKPNNKCIAEDNLGWHITFCSISGQCRCTCAPALRRIQQHFRINLTAVSMWLGSIYPKAILTMYVPSRDAFLLHVSRSWNSSEAGCLQARGFQNQVIYDIVHRHREASALYLRSTLHKQNSKFDRVHENRLDCAQNPRS